MLLIYVVSVRATVHFWLYQVHKVHTCSTAEAAYRFLKQSLKRILLKEMEWQKEKKLLEDDRNVLPGLVVLLCFECCVYLFNPQCASTVCLCVCLLPPNCCIHGINMLKKSYCAYELWATYSA